jgi:hypothetical protein
MTALREAALTDPSVQAYLAAVEHVAPSEDITALSYQELKPRLADMRPFRLSSWGYKASSEDLESAARGLLAAQTPADQLLHVDIFRQRPFPLDPTLLTQLVFTANEKLAYAAAVALSNVTHPSVRQTAFRLIEDRHPAREWAVAMLNENFQSNDHETVMRWFENEPDRDARHRMQMDLDKFWEQHADATSEVRMLHLLYEKGPCSFCREYDVRRLLELNALSPSQRAECAYDANEDIRELVSAPPPSP